MFIALGLIVPSTLQGRQPHRPGAHRPEAHSAARRDTTPDTRQEHAALEGPLGIPMTRHGSGTSWLPDLTPMYMLHRPAGSWDLMLMGSAFVHYVDEEAGDRGGNEFGSTNWFMGMAQRPLAGGTLTLQAMLSLDPATQGECGYPDLLATGESCDALGPLHDRQHPHDLFMELSARYQRALSNDVAFEVYGGPVAEPAIGPVAFPHRTSAFANLFSPIGHHWMDATHISFGVVTAGVFGRRWKLEGSLFNGREPDEERFGIDPDALDSFSGRLWILPDERWAVQVSVGRLNEAELPPAGGERRDVTRVTASVTHHRPAPGGGLWATTGAWGRNIEEGEENETDAYLLESTLGLNEKDVFFARVELAEKPGEDLVPGDAELEEEGFWVAKLQVGYQHQLGAWGGLLPGIGVSLSTSLVGEKLEGAYGERTPVGFAAWVSVRPAPATMATPSHEMEH